MTAADPKHAPGKGKNQFQCPQCNVVAQHEWSEVTLTNGKNVNAGHSVFLNTKLTVVGNFNLSCCYVCRNITLWQDGLIVWPSPNQILPPSEDMPDNVKGLFEEARGVYALSPKSAAALLRLAIQVLCVDLGGKGENLNSDIAKLVEEGLPRKIQQALDVVRVIGNNAVHPGVISIDDNPQTVSALFKLVNLIVENMITQPAEVGAMFESLPNSAKAQIEKRDS